MFYKTFLSLIVLVTSASAQPVIGGLILGAPLTDAIRVNSVPAFAAVSANNGEFVIGPFVEIKLPLKFSLEVDALHRGYNFVSKVRSGPSRRVDSCLVISVE
ncbi:MAG: hypothetical protein ABSB35_11255 [Bryobacteraceae bacterium]